MTEHVGEVIEPPGRSSSGLALTDEAGRYEAVCSCGWRGSAPRWSLAADALIQHRDEAEDGGP
jgi:hypothetical protein